MTTPEEMAGRRCVYKAGDRVRVQGSPRTWLIDGIDDGVALIVDAVTGSCGSVPVSLIEGLVVNCYPGDLNPRVDHKAMRERPTAKGLALTRSALDVLATASDILTTYEQGDHTPQKFAALGKHLVRGMARHAVLECVPAFVFEVAK